MKKDVVLDKVSAILVCDEFNRRFFSDIDNSEGYVLVTNDKIVYFADARYYSALVKKTKGKNVIAKLYISSQSVKEELMASGIKRVFIDYSVTTLSCFEEYKTLGVAIENGTKLIRNARAIKNENEIQTIKTACDITVKAFEQIIPYIKKGVTELSIKNRLIKFMKKAGAEGESFSAIVAFGENSAVPHHETGKTRLKENSVVLMDFGCKYNGYCSDLTRTLFFGNPGEDFVNLYNLVAEVNRVSKENAVEGIKASNLDSLARKFFAEYNQERFFTHSLGHGVGLEIHEEPFVSKKGDCVLQNGTVFTIEPGLYYDNRFGIRIEDTVVMQNGKVQSLTGNGYTLIKI